jgi:ribonuclease HI
MNRDLWEELSIEVARRDVEWVKVAGHTGVELNEHEDQLVCAQLNGPWDQHVSATIREKRHPVPNDIARMAEVRVPQ